WPWPTLGGLAGQKPASFILPAAPSKRFRPASTTAPPAPPVPPLSAPPEPAAFPPASAAVVAAPPAPPALVVVPPVVTPLVMVELAVAARVLLEVALPPAPPSPAESSPPPQYSIPVDAAKYAPSKMGVAIFINLSPFA